jgi:pyruvyltransferase
METLKVYQWKGRRAGKRRIPNVGDTLSKPILEYFLKRSVEIVNATAKNKLVAVGSVMWAIKPGDVVWGTGSLTGKKYSCKGAVILAVRGELTRRVIKDAEVPEVYGDPALLLPLLYHPNIKQKYELGVIPHYVDRYRVPAKYKRGRIISIALPWQEFINEILSCKRIISSSLHGLIIAEAYGIPVSWAIWSPEIKKQAFKFKDYLTGTGREPQSPFKRFPPIPDLKKIQDSLIKALIEYYANT